MELIQGLTSAIASSSIVYPIEVLKTNYQASRLNINTSNNSLKTIIRNIYTKQGVKGFYRGLSTQLGTHPIFWSIFFQARKYEPLNTNNKYINKVSNVFWASSIASTIANPFYVFRNQFQTEVIKKRNNLTYSVLAKELYQKNGVSWMLKGMGVTLGNNTKLCIQFPLYDVINEKTNNIIISSLGSKTITSVIFYPFDFIRTQQRSSIENLSIRKITSDIYLRNGLRGFYSGVGIYTATSTPNFILMMVFRDLMKKHLN